MSNLRKKYQATKIKSLKSQVAKEDTMTSSGGGKNNYLTIKDGSNKFRIFPTVGDAPFMVMRGVHWVSLSNDDGTEGTYRSTVLNAKVHAGLSKSLFEEYMKNAKEILQEQSDTDGIKHLTGRDGIKLQTSWLCYARTTSGDIERGLLEIKKTVRDKLIENAVIEDDEEVIEIDPYSDPDSGHPILIKFNKSAQRWQDYYKVSMARNALPMEDEDFEFLDASTPLSEVVVYKMSDFEKALQGLENYDSEQGIGVFAEESWSELVEELRDELKSILGKSEKTEESVVESSDVEEDEIEDDEIDEIEDDEIEDLLEEEDEDEYTNMSRKDLKKQIVLKVKEQPNRKSELRVKRSMSEEDIRNMLRAFDEKVVEVAVIEGIEDDEEAVDSLDDIKKRLMNM